MTQMQMQPQQTQAGSPYTPSGNTPILIVARDGMTKVQVAAEMGVTLRVRAEVYSRIVGYMRPIRNWNAGKIAEYNERKVYRTPGKMELA